MCYSNVAVMRKNNYTKLNSDCATADLIEK